MDRHLMSPEMIFGRLVRQLRSEQGWSQRYFADRLGELDVHLHQSAIHKMENGQRSIRLDEAAAIAHLLRVPIDRLIQPPVSDEEIMLLDVQLDEVDISIKRLTAEAEKAREQMTRAQVERERAERALASAMDAMAAAEAELGREFHRQATLNAMREEAIFRKKHFSDHEDMDQKHE